MANKKGVRMKDTGREKITSCPAVLDRGWIQCPVCGAVFCRIDEGGTADGLEVKCRRCGGIYRIDGIKGRVG